MNEVRVITSAPTSSGSVTAGAIQVGFRVSSGGAAAIGSVPITDATPINLESLALGGTYPAIAYTVSSGTLYIVEVRE